MNDTPQGDGNRKLTTDVGKTIQPIRMNDTPQGDGNLYKEFCSIQYNKRIR